MGEQSGGQKQAVDSELTSGQGLNLTGAYQRKNRLKCPVVVRSVRERERVRVRDSEASCITCHTPNQ